LLAGGGAVSRDDAFTVLSRASLDDKVRRGELVTVFPRAYVRPWDADDRQVRLRAALRSVGGDVALSHVTALERWSLPVPEDAPIHVTAYNPRHPRGIPGELVVHRTLLPLDAVVRDDLPIVKPELAVVTSWPLLDGPMQRAPLIMASRKRLVRPARIRDLAERMWWVEQRAALLELVGLILAGCQSELELWGYTGVFNVPGLDDAERQLRVVVEGQTYWLDMAYVAEKLAIELDGRAFHSSDEQREWDEKRDIAVAKIGWQTLRLGHFRLHNDVEGCRRDVLAVRAARRLHVS
jgi:hypothetical protein